MEADSWCFSDQGIKDRIKGSVHEIERVGSKFSTFWAGCYYFCGDSFKAKVVRRQRKREAD